MIKLEQIEQILAKFEITIDMFYVLYLMHINDKAQLRKYKAIVMKYRDRTLTDKEIESLLQTGLLTRLPDGSFKPTDKFVELFVDKYRAANQFWDAYPSYIKSGDGEKMLPLKLIDVQLFYELYNTTLGGVLAEHTKIMEDLRYAVKHKFPFSKIDTYVRSKQWLEVRKIRESGIWLDKNGADNNIENDF